MALLVLSMGLMLVPSSSWAGPEWCTAEPAPTPAPPGVGMTEMASVKGLNHIYETQQLGAYSPEELGSSGEYQHRGMVWHVITTEDCLDGNRFDFWAAIYGPMLTTSMEVSQLAANLYMVASADTYQLMFHDLIVEVTNQLRDHLWRPLIPTMVILGAVTLAWYAFVRRQATMTLQSAVWMVVGTGLGMYMLFAPAQVLNLATALTSGGSSLINQAVSNISVDGLSERCPSDAAQPVQSDFETDGQFAARQNTQMVWEGLMCRPWVEGLLGSSDHARAVADKHGMELLEATTITKQEAEDEEYQQLLTDKQNLYQGITDSVLDGATAEEPNTEYEIFSGANGSHRLSTAIAALMGSLTGSLMIMLASLLLVVYKFAFAVSMMLAPIFLLIGIHPSGRTILLKWAGFTVAHLLKQVMVMLMIGLLVLVISLILALPAPLSMQSILMVGLMIGLIMAWKPIWSLFRGVSTLSDRAINTDQGRLRMPQALRNLGRTAVRAGTAAATGGSALAAAGLPIGGRGARAAGSAARGVGRRVPLGIKRAETDPRWGRVLNAQRATDGEGAVKLRGSGALNRVRDAAGVRPTSPEWRQENPVMAGWEAHRWAGMNSAERRSAVKEARSDPSAYMSKLREERQGWAHQVRAQKQGAPPPLTPHQQKRVTRADAFVQKRVDRWAHRRPTRRRR